MTNDEIYALAKSLLNPKKLNKRTKISDTVCVLETVQGNIYSGVSLVATCGLGYCSEQAAISQMLNSGENQISKMIIVDKFDNIFPPCGKCLELITQICDENDKALIVLRDNSYTIRELYPLDWKKIKDTKIN